MHIAIDARYVNDHFPGIGRYVYNVLRELAHGAHDHDLLVLHNPALPNTRHDLAALARAPHVELVATHARPFSFGEQFMVPRLLRRLHADVYHAPYYVRPYVGLPCPVVVTLYDAIPRLFPGEVSLRARLLFDLLTRLAARDARRIFAISHSARADLIAAYGLKPERVIVTPLAADERFHPQPAERVAAMRARYGLPEHYILTVGSNKPHKNLARLIEAFVHLTTDDSTTNREPHSLSSSVPQFLQFPRSRAAVQLVIAGHRDAHDDMLRATIARHELHDRVHVLPNVAEADLPALYSGALLFAFPSLYEGFGLPPLEAMACGTPVVCGATSSLPEVVGEAALAVNTRDPAALAHGMATLLGDAALRERLRSAGLARARQFSWRRTAEATLRGMEDAMVHAT
jgi:glycosyltransferase involved in cell wall biosynthesis